jgi:cell division protein FtsW (lipid II flippase)
MAETLKAFEWLMYGSLAIGVATGVMGGEFKGGDVIWLIAIVAIVAALVWLAAHKAQRWAAWILVAFVALSILVLIADLSGGSVKWLADNFGSNPPPSTLAKILDAVAVVMGVAALVFYFGGGRSAPRP